MSAEIDRLKQKIGQTHKDTSTYAQLERKYETLIKEVRNLEGNLADYNLAMDKSRTGTVRADAIPGTAHQWLICSALPSIVLPYSIDSMP